MNTFKITIPKLIHRKMRKTSLIVFLVCSFIILIFYNCNQNKKITKENALINNGFQPWEEGFLDIHHLSTGGGDASFFIFPDGTTMLFDAGRLNKEKFENKYAPLKSTSQKPNDSLSIAEWISVYIKNAIPKDKESMIDYGLISHFHEDHYGSFVELGEIIPFRKIIDRNYPHYNYPLDLENYLSDDSMFQKYISFLNVTNAITESFISGSSSQISLLKQPNEYRTFQVRNIKSNATIWTGKDDNTFEYFTPKEMTDYYKGKYNENPLSLALKISYGNFDYFTGGDNTGLKGFGLPYWFDVETPIAKAVGNVEVTTLNHHGNRDATNEFFIKTLNPKVVVQQSWCSDHPGQEVYQRMIYNDENTEERDIFATDIHDETLITYGPWFKNSYKSIHGHVVIRVYPLGDKYEVFVLNDNSSKLIVKQKYGPYYSK